MEILQTCTELSIWLLHVVTTKLPRNVYLSIYESNFDKSSVEKWKMCYDCFRASEAPIKYMGNIGRFLTLQWRYNGRNGVSNHQHHHCLLNRLFRRRSKKPPKPRVTGHYVGNSPVTGEFPAQRASNAENVSIWWRHHTLPMFVDFAVHRFRLNFITLIGSFSVR